MSEKVKVLRALIKASLNAKQISNKTKKPLKTIYRILNSLCKQGLINKLGYPALFDLTGEGRFFLSKKTKDSQNTFSAFPEGVKNEKLGFLPFGNVRLHAFSVKFPLLGEIKAQPSWWDRQQKMRGGWVKYWKFLLDKGIKVEASHKSVILHFEVKWVRLSFKDFDSVRFQRLAVAADVHKYLKLRNVDFDLFKGMVIRQHGASSLQGELKEQLPKGKTEELFLSRPAVGVWPAEFEARAWIDSSSGPEFEANDDLYWRKWLMVPETVARMGKDLPALKVVLSEYKASIALYDAQIKKHLAVMEKIGAYFDTGGKQKKSSFFEPTQTRLGG